LRARLEPMQADMEAELGRLREQDEHETRRLKQIIERLQR
jgi:MerR family transcriptional regulator/heat shock protein HspR